MAHISSKVLDNLKSSSRVKTEEAFDILYKEYSYLVYYVALKIVKNRDIAKEITNDTFFKLYQNKDNLKKEKNIKYYLVTTSKNTSINYMIQNARQVSLDGEIASFEQVDHFDEYINKFSKFLNKEELDIIVYHLLYDFSFREISKENKTTTSAVSSKYRRAIDKIKSHYKKGEL